MKQHQLPLASLCLAAALTGSPGHAAEGVSDGWQSLFDGHSLDGWRAYDQSGFGTGWTVEDGTLHFPGAEGVDIITVDSFANFELELEWKVAPGGNSGIFYLAPTGLEQIYMGAPEYQVLDDAGHVDGGSELTSAGANYGLHGAARGIVRPAGEWNQARIVVRGREVEHWLNGQQIVAYTLGSPEWEALVAASKFAAWPAYGRAKSGHIGLQDHGDPVWFRNIRLREFD